MAVPSVHCYIFLRHSSDTMKDEMKGLCDEWIMRTLCWWPKSKLYFGFSNIPRCSDRNVQSSPHVHLACDPIKATYDDHGDIIYSKCKV